jgi:hypothetical protein
VLFANPGISFIACRRDRGISYQVDENFSRYTKLEKASGAVSRYKLSRSQNLSWYRELYCLQMRVSGFKAITNFSGQPIVTVQRLKRKEKFGPILNIWFLLGWRSRHQAKSMTNNLPLLSVLCLGF